MDDPWSDHRIYIDARLPERYRRAPSPDNERAVNRPAGALAEPARPRQVFGTQHVLYPFVLTESCTALRAARVVLTHLAGGNRSM